MNLLPDIIGYFLKVLFIGFNPGMKSAASGHHYAGNSNSFWKLLYESGLTSVRLKPEEDVRLLELGMGSANIADRPTRSAAELTACELREGTVSLMTKLREYSPQIACYMGIGAYRIVTGQKMIKAGAQPAGLIEGITDYVCSSPSGLNRIPYPDQLSYFKGLKILVDSSDISLL